MFNSSSSTADHRLEPTTGEAANYEERVGLISEDQLDGARPNRTQSSWYQHLSRIPSIILARAARCNPRTAFSSAPRESSSNETPSSRRNTAYLDGLRGVAALCVLFTHTQEWAQSDYGNNVDVLRASYGHKGPYLFACLPGIRLFFGGGGGVAVSLFFVMSGYVLSSKSHRLILSRDLGSLTKCVSSAIFRRWFRLFLPIFAINFMWMTSWYLGVKSVRPEHDHWPISDSYTAELHRLFNVMSELSSLFGAKERERFRIYNPPIWTIPAEFEGSVVVYMSMLGLSQFTPKFHFLGEAILCMYFLHLRQFSLALFVSGMMICHVDTINRETAAIHHLHLGPILQKRMWIVWCSLWIGGIYLGSLFENLWANFFSAILMMIAAPRIHLIKTLLESWFCQYLGKVSYALYLTHMPVLWIIGGRIFAFFGRYRGEPELYGSWGNVISLPAGGPVGLEINTIVPSFFFFLFAFATANVATKFIDEPSVRFAQWLYFKRQ